MCDVRTWGCLLSFNTWRVRVGSSMCESHMRYKNFEYPRRQNYFPARCSWPHFTFSPETPSKGLQAERESTFMNTFSTKTFLFLSPRYFCHSSDSDPKFIRSVFLLFFFYHKDIPRYAIISCSSAQCLHLGQHAVTDAECSGQLPDIYFTQCIYFCLITCCKSLSCKSAWTGTFTFDERSLFVLITEKS